LLKKLLVSNPFFPLEQALSFINAKMTHSWVIFSIFPLEAKVVILKALRSSRELGSRLMSNTPELDTFDDVIRLFLSI